MEINEEIVKEYFCLVKKCFVQENVLYKVTTQREGKKKGGGWSDIDLLAYSPVSNNILDIEVKYREKAPFHRGKDKASNLDRVIENYVLEPRVDRIKNLNHQSLPVERVFVTNKKAFTQKTRSEYEKLLSSKNITLIYFEDIFEELQEHYKENPNKMKSVIGQIFRMLNNRN